MRFLNLKILSLFTIILVQSNVFAVSPEAALARKMAEFGQNANEKEIQEMLAEIDATNFEVNAYIDRSGGSLLGTAIQHAPWAIIDRLIGLGAQLRGTVFRRPTDSGLHSTTTILHTALAYDRVDILPNLVSTYTYLLDERNDEGSTASQVAKEYAEATDDWSVYQALKQAKIEARKKAESAEANKSNDSDEECARGRRRKRANSQEISHPSKRVRSQERSTDSDDEDGEGNNWGDSDREEEANSQSTADTEIVNSQSYSQDNAGNSTRTNSTDSRGGSRSYLNPLYASQESLD